MVGGRLPAGSVRIVANEGEAQRFGADIRGNVAALQENATGSQLSGWALTYHDGRTEEICPLDRRRADSCPAVARSV